MLAGAGGTIGHQPTLVKLLKAEAEDLTAFREGRVADTRRFLRHQEAQCEASLL